MGEVFVGNAIGDDDDTDIGGVELMVDHRAVADETTDTEITLHQRRKRGNGRAGINLRDGRFGIDLVHRQ